MKKQTKNNDKYKADPINYEELFDGINNEENGYPVSPKVLATMTDNLTHRINQLISVSPTTKFRDFLQPRLNELSERPDLKALFELFIMGIYKFNAIIDPILEDCNGAFSITLGTLQLLKLQA